MKPKTPRSGADAENTGAPAPDFIPPAGGSYSFDPEKGTHVRTASTKAARLSVPSRPVVPTKIPSETPEAEEKSE